MTTSERESLLCVVWFARKGDLLAKMALVEILATERRQTILWKFSHGDVRPSDLDDGLHDTCARVMGIREAIAQTGAKVMVAVVIAMFAGYWMLAGFAGLAIPSGLIPTLVPTGLLNNPLLSLMLIFGGMGIMGTVAAALIGGSHGRE